jgi:hypothetical protein
MEHATEAPIVISWTRAIDGALIVGPTIGEVGAADTALMETGEAFRRWFDADANPVRIADAATDPRFGAGFPGLGVAGIKPGQGCKKTGNIRLLT